MCQRSVSCFLSFSQSTSADRNGGFLLDLVTCVIWPLQNDIAKWAQAANWLVLCTHYGWHLGALV